MTSPDAPGVGTLENDDASCHGNGSIEVLGGGLPIMAPSQAGGEGAMNPASFQ